jgi:hypothetical protein
LSARSDMVSGLAQPERITPSVRHANNINPSNGFSFTTHLLDLVRMNQGLLWD